MQKAKTVNPPVDKVKLLSRCKELIKDYPSDCVEFDKIKKQIEQLESEV